MRSTEDAHGRAIFDCYQGVPATELVERDDGWIAASPGPSLYLAPFNKWPKHERAAMRYVRGRVLDAGCGAGRACLYLQQRGQRVVGIDNSALAVKTARLRGVHETRLMSVTRVNARLGTFDTVLMLGNNFGLMGNRKRARWLLRRFADITSVHGRIVATAVDPYDTQDRDHRQYHRRNRSRGRMGGQVRIRVRYGKYRTQWFDWLLVSRREMQQLLEGMCWKVERFIDSGGPGYVAVLRKSVD